MLEKIILTKDFRVLKAGDEFVFRPGVNLLVGEQGSGKSSLLALLSDDRLRKTHAKIVCPEAVETKFFDFEKHNPRTKSRVDTMVDVSMRFASHGECVNALLRAFENEFINVVAMADEPDMALSIRSCYKLIKTFDMAVEHGCQVIAAVHNPIIISSQKQVLSLDHKAWVDSARFIAEHSRLDTGG